MDKETMRHIASTLGLSEEELKVAVAYQALIKTSLELTNLALFMKQNNVLTDEVAERFHQSVRNYLVELRLILGAQADIESLRQEP